MPRPRKKPEEKKNKRLTVYFTESEESRLEQVSRALDKDKAKIVRLSLDKYIRTMEEPPESIRKARQEFIMNQEKENLTGYICSYGHAFFIESVWPSAPKNCPCCGDNIIKSTWNGVIKKGF